MMSSGRYIWTMCSRLERTKRKRANPPFDNYIKPLPSLSWLNKILARHATHLIAPPGTDEIEFTRIERANAKFPLKSAGFTNR